MKIKWILFLICVFIACSLSAQRVSVVSQFYRPGNDTLAIKERHVMFKEYWEKIELQKMDFLKEKMELSEDTVKKFWPVYHEMNQKRFGISEKIADEIKRITTLGDRATEKDYTEHIEIINHLEQDKLDNKIFYYNKLMKIISAKKLFRLEHLERQFRRKLVTQISTERK